MDKKLCKKLTFNNGFLDGNANSSTILGIIESEDDFFITFKTARRIIRVSKKEIISIADTDIIFRQQEAQA